MKIILEIAVLTTTTIYIIFSSDVVNQFQTRESLKKREKNK